MEKIILTSLSLEDFSKVIQEAVSTALLGHTQKNVQKENEYELLTRIEAMKFLKVKATKFNEMRQRGLVLPIRVDGKKTLYLKEDLVNYCLEAKAER
jgi:predicted RecB family endonuclease